MADDERRAYVVSELGPVRNGVQRNEPVVELGDIETHHPRSNMGIHMQDGVIAGAENPARRSYAYIGGQFQEVEMRRTDEYGSLRPDQVLLVKDFILEDPQSEHPRNVDVPSPTPGHVGRVDARNGVVEIHDRQGGDVIARIRHLNPVSVQAGDQIAYGQALGTQNRQGLPANAGKHVHIEMDTAYYQQLENYVGDLTNGRLAVQAQYRENVQPQPVIDDGTFRLGQSSERIRDLQRVMANEGYRSASGGPLDQDGVYRPSMQGALLDFQRAHGVPQTGDIDPATLGMAPPVLGREADRHDHTASGRPPVPAPESRAPGHPDHRDHRQNMPDPLPPPVNQPAPTRLGPADRNHPDHAMLEQIREGVRQIDAGIGKPYDDTSERLGRSLLAQCKENGLRRVDHVVMGRDGANIFAVQGGVTDPLHLRAHVSTEQAIRTPVEQSDERLLAVNQAITQQQDLARQQELSRGSDDPNRGMVMR